MAIDPFLGQFMVQAGVAGVNAITRGGPKRQYKWNKKAAADSNAMNRTNAEWALNENRKIQEEQRLYDSPESQMARYKKAGLNPHLIYGSGSSAGSAFPIQAPQIAPSRTDAPQPFDLNLQAPSYIGAQLAESNIALQAQKQQESEAKVALMEIQTDIAKTNPMLNPYVYKSTLFQLEAVANQKAQEARYLSDFAPGASKTYQEQKMDAGLKAVQTSIDKLYQEIGLNAQKMRAGEIDIEIKNKILESKEYQNALSKIQKEWMENGDITPQHIWQGIMLLLQNMTR